MRLQLFIENKLAANVDFSRIADTIKKDCQPILKIYQKRWKRHERWPWLFRGVGKGAMVPFKKKSAHLENRKPMSTGKEMHDWMNEYFKKRFGWPVRNGVSCTGNSNQAGTYGRPYIFFPIGKLQFCWNPDVWDLWSAIQKRMPELNKPQMGFGDEIPPKYGRERDKFQNEIMPLFEKYTDKNLDKAISQGYEILFNSPQYYLLSPYDGTQALVKLDLADSMFAEDE